MFIGNLLSKQYYTIVRKAILERNMLDVAQDQKKRAFTRSNYYEILISFFGFSFAWSRFGISIFKIPSLWFALILS